MIKTEDAHLNISSASHPGMTGKENEDRYGVSAFLTGDKENQPAVLAVLCDGIGGHKAGEVAAAMGVEMITRLVTDSDGSQPVDTLAEAITQASEAIYETSHTDQGFKGMGSTCACAWVIGERLFTANLGDSRIYLLRDDHLIQLTTDHTWIQEALDAGIITDPVQDMHPNAHVIRRYLGSEKPPQPDFRLWFFEGESAEDALTNQGLPLLPGDKLLLCSDGLTDLVEDQEIRDILVGTPLSQVPDILVETANRRGGHDNTTVVLLEVPPRGKDNFSRKKKNRKFIGVLGVILFISFLTVFSIISWERWGLSREDDLSPTPDIMLTEPGELFLITPDAVSPTVVFTATLEGQGIEDEPVPTITPWPTHTRAP